MSDNHQQSECNNETILPLKIKESMKLSILDDIQKLRNSYTENLVNNASEKSGAKSAFYKKLQEIQDRKEQQKRINSAIDGTKERLEVKIANSESSEQQDSLIFKRSKNGQKITDFFRLNKRLLPQSIISKPHSEKVNAFNIQKDNALLTNLLNYGQNTSNSKQSSEFTFDSSQLTIDQNESTFDGYNASSQLNHSIKGSHSQSNINKRLQKINLKLTEKRKGPRKINIQKSSIFDNLTESESSNMCAKQNKSKKSKKSKKAVFSQQNICNFKRSIESQQSQNDLEQNNEDFIGFGKIKNSYQGINNDMGNESTEISLVNNQTIDSQSIHHSQ
ncbi:UNKNOWN [Stylonychia lemnae]|uniref:Uncharacterized protein n=1 Tax=Stylonychia lemnae TaxID=5949 RepID=A0A077ZZ52_STYLE|nr:UNKNOWN [Stylonychia lemnae]|eukprot:CDW75205.1 UNKNOWN [Stylonychia lemnae]